MAHIQRRCPKCSIVVGKGKRACIRCAGKTFSYRVRYVDPDGAEKSKTFRRLVDAETFVTSVSHSILAGSYIDPTAGQQTVKEYLEEWRLGQVHHRPKTAAGTKTRFEQMVYPYLGHLPIGKLRPSTIRTWQKTLLESGQGPGKGYAPSTVKGARGQVAGAFKAAILDRRITSSPFEGVKAPELPEVKIVPLTVSQIRAGQAAVPDDRYRAIIPVVAGSGIRQGELFGLTVDRVDFLRRTIRIDQQLVGRKGPAPIFGPPKTKSSYRTIPVGNTVIKELAAHLAAYPAGPGDLIFRTARNTPLSRTVFGRVWKPAAKAMGLAKGEGLHQLRHFYASLLIADGRNVKEVQERLGHKDATETLNTYSHLWHSSDDTTRDAIDRAFAEDDDGQAAESGT